jgi:hypothetical protein
MKRLWPLLALALVGGCKDKVVAARADSLQAVTAEQARLAQTLAAQKDSLTTIVLDADAFISSIDSQISRVKGLPAKRRSGPPAESPIEEQLHQRRAMLARVSALVDRAQATATQLEASRRRERALKGQNATLVAQVDQSKALIAQLGTTIERQTTTIAGLQARIDTLSTEKQALGRELQAATVAQHKAYYIVGTERELLDKGVIVRTGGANLLFKKVGRSLQPARQVKADLFTAVDQRGLTEIAVPKADRRYRIVSRQALGATDVSDARKGEFRGNLHITDAAQFWAPSRYLIIVEL